MLRILCWFDVTFDAVCSLLESSTLNASVCDSLYACSLAWIALQSKSVDNKRLSLL